MNGMLERLQTERAGLVQFVDETLARANEENRDLVDAEQRNLTTSQERLTLLDAQIKPLAEFEQLRAATVQIDSRLTGPIRTTPRPADPQFRSFGSLYVDSEDFQERGVTARVELGDVRASELAMQTRATVVTGAAPGQNLLPPNQQYAISAPVFRTPLLDAITRIPVTTGTVDLITWSDPTGFAEVAEGAEKPEVSFVTGVTPTPLPTIAGWIQYSRQMAADAPALRALLDGGLTRGLLRELQAKVAAAISGATLPPTTGAAGQDLIEVIRLGIATVEDAGFTANSLLGSPQALASLDISVLSLGGAAATVMGGGTWSLTPIAVPGMTDIIVADASAAFVLFERTGIEIFTTDSDVVGTGATMKSGFRSNILTTLAETRALGAVQNPNAATEITVTP